MIEELIKSNIRDVPNFPKKGIIFKDITPILKNQELCTKIVEAFLEKLKGIEFDAVAGIESRGFLFGLMLANKLNKPFIPIRKAGKLPYKTIQQSYNLEYGSATVEMHVDAISEGERVLIHAAAGGVGRAKTAGNYAAALYPAKKGQENGYHQLLWTDAKEHKFIEESGTMNICFMINGTLVTPSEDEDTILRGTTKRTLVDVAVKWGIPVEERKVSVEELVKAIEDGTLNEAFGAGTAATIATIVKIGYRDGDFILAEPTENDFSMKAKKYLDDLKAGKTEDVDGWCPII